MKAVLKALLAKTPYTLQKRTSQNRFQAGFDSIKMLSDRGFRPPCIIDGGANIGAFSDEMLALFPQAQIHAIEPQPGCQTALEGLQARADGRVHVHATALADPDRSGTTLQMSTDPNATSTGAHISLDGTGADHVIDVPCEMLDSLVTPSPEDQGWFLKLDLQGYEMQALRGATKTLAATDVVLSEVSFYAQAYEPPISELVGYLAEHGFELYDIATLYARPRDNRPRQGDFLFLRRGCALDRDKGWA